MHSRKASLLSFVRIAYFVKRGGRMQEIEQNFKGKVALRFATMNELDDQAIPVKSGTQGCMRPFFFCDSVSHVDMPKSERGCRR